MDEGRGEGGPVGGELAQLGDSEGVDEVIVELGEAAGFAGLRVGVVGEEVADFGVEGQLEGAAVEAALDELGAQLFVGDEDFSAGGRVELGFSGGGIDGGRGTIEDVAAEAVSEVGGEEVDEDAADSGGVEAPASGGMEDGVEGEDEVSLGVPVPAGEMKAEDDGVGQAVPALEEDLGDGGGADVDAGGEVSGEGAEEVAGEVGDGLAAAVRRPSDPSRRCRGCPGGRSGRAGGRRWLGFGFLRVVVGGAGCASLPRLSCLFTPGIGRDSGGGRGRRVGRLGCPSGRRWRDSRGSR